MRITAATVGKQHTYTVMTENGASAAVDKTVWEHSGYATGADITEEEWDALLARSQAYRAHEKALYYLSLRDYGGGEMIQKLRQAGVPRPLAEQTVARLRESGLIDDARYAALLAQDMASRKLYPKRRIAMALREKGFDAETVEMALEKLPDNEVQQALELLHKKRYNELDSDAARQKALACLARYGFSYAASRRALEQYDEETE